MKDFARRRIVVFGIAPQSTATKTLRNESVKCGIVSALNRGPGCIAITRSVSADGVNFTVLPRARKVAPQRHAIIRLPGFAVFTTLTISTFKLPSTTVLRWTATRCKHK